MKENPFQLAAQRAREISDNQITSMKNKELTKLLKHEYENGLISGFMLTLVFASFIYDAVLLWRMIK